MAIYAEQGEILELKGRVRYVLVLSKDLFNQTGMSIVCPVVENAFEDALHIPVRSGRIQGIALCKQIILSMAFSFLIKLLWRKKVKGK